jgi:hypothetical protein
VKGIGYVKIDRVHWEDPQTLQRDVKDIGQSLKFITRYLNVGTSEQNFDLYDELTNHEKMTEYLNVEEKMDAFQAN